MKKDEDFKLVPIGHTFEFNVPSQMMLCRGCSAIIRHPTGYGFEETNRQLLAILYKHQDCKKLATEKSS